MTHSKPNSKISYVKQWGIDLEKRVTTLSSEDFPTPFLSFEWLLVLLSRIYGVVVQCRLILYNFGILKARKAPCPVISIGNIVVGGSGKTPMTIYLAEMLKKKGYYPVVLSRGYGGANEKGKEAVIAGDGKTILSASNEVGDEPFMMASKKSFPVVVCRDRFRGVIKAVEFLKEQKNKNNGQARPPVMILDDGFQHIQLKRDLNIMMMDCNRPFGNGRLLPAGRLREPTTSLKRAEVAVFTRCLQSEQLNDEIKETVWHKFSQELGSNMGNILKDRLFRTSHAPYLHRYMAGAACVTTKENPLNSPNALNSLAGKKALLFSGIANNASFRECVEKLGIHVVEHLEFNDHHMYKSEDIFWILEKYDSCDANLIMITEKDHARLNFKNEWPMDVAVVGVEIDFCASEEKERFEALVMECIKD